MTMTTTTRQTYESRWGFHPCDHETFLKLKEIHGLLLMAYKDCKRNIQWNNKLPENRKGPEPRAPKDFIERGLHKLDKKQFYGLGFRRHKGRNLYLHVLEQYQVARRPQPTAYDVEQLDLPEGLDKIVERLKQFYGESE